MHLAAGTSGYCYKEWRGHFYPEKMAEADMLSYYGEKLPTVEINNTFYRMPAPAMLERWASEVPPDFVFTLKAPRRITQEQRLKDCESSVNALMERASVLGNRLGTFLFQTPHFFKKDVPRLKDFLQLLPPDRKCAFDFRNATWQHDDVYAALRERGAIWCVTDNEEGETPFVATADCGYLRLRRTHYEDNELAAWAERIAAQNLPCTYVYFMHEDEALGARFALRLNELWNQRRP